MEFELSPEITDEIIFAMEDQTAHFLYDSSVCRAVAVRDGDSIRSGAGLDEDDDRYYALPVWDSISGFRIMDRFVSQLRNPIVREELRAALSLGHGVFRNFKNILKAHPEVERLWFQFKEREMRLIVLEWYNNLRDFWGLERIGAEPEETTDIVAQDFQFRPFVPSDEETLASLIDSIDEEIAGQFEADLSESLIELSLRIRANGDGELVWVAESAEGDLVGCAISSPLPAHSLRTAQLDVIAVFPEFRGLGIGKELLSGTIAHWAGKGYRWLLFSGPIVPSAFFPVLRRSGFMEKGHVSVLDLASVNYH